MTDDATKQLCKLIPLAAAALAVGFVVGRYVFPIKAKVNVRQLRKEKDKVVDSFSIEDIGDGKYFCRCWRSKNFPFCDGSHNDHNRLTGDNVGPLGIKKASSSA